VTQTLDVFGFIREHKEMAISGFMDIAYRFSSSTMVPLPGAFCL